MPLRTALFDDNEPAPGNNMRQQRPLFDDADDDLALLRGRGVLPGAQDDGSPVDALPNGCFSSDAGDGFFDLQRPRHARSFGNLAATGDDFMDVGSFGALFGGNGTSSQAASLPALDAASPLACGDSNGTSAPDYQHSELQLGSGLRRVLVRSTTGQQESECTVGAVPGNSPAHAPPSDGFAEAMASLDLDAGHSPSNEAKCPSPTTVACVSPKGKLSCRSMLRISRKRRRVPLVGPWQVFQHERYGKLQAPATKETNFLLSGPWKEVRAEALRLVAESL